MAKRRSCSHNLSNNDITIEFISIEFESMLKAIEQECLSVEWYQDHAAVHEDIAFESISVIKTGEPENRIDVVFMGDGYTASERERFVQDIKRLTEDMWKGDTFKSYLPLFNIWALFAPSAESGIGVNSTPKNTVFGLYRDGTELRGVYTSK
jgi:hypothetical protein